MYIFAICILNLQFLSLIVILSRIIIVIILIIINYRDRRLRDLLILTCKAAQKGHE